MKRVGSLAAVNAAWATLTTEPFVQSCVIAGDPDSREGGIVLIDVEIENEGPQATISVNRNFGPPYCVSTPDTWPVLKTIPAGTPSAPFYDRLTIPTMMAVVADVTQQQDAAAPPINPCNLQVSAILSTPGNVKVKLHLSGIFIRLSEGTGTNAPWW